MLRNNIIGVIALAAVMIDEVIHAAAVIVIILEGRYKLIVGIEALAELLSKTQGVGKAQVLISESGVVVACSGASNASVRLDMIRAVSAYTGFGSDKIIILKLRN